MPTFALQTRAASGHDEVEELKTIFHGAKNVVRECLNTESYPLDPLTGVAGTCIEVNLMDSRFDILLTVDALEAEERLADAQIRVNQICNRLARYTTTRKNIGVWLNLGGHNVLGVDLHPGVMTATFGDHPPSPCGSNSHPCDEEPRGSFVYYFTQKPARFMGGLFNMLS